MMNEKLRAHLMKRGGTMSVRIPSELLSGLKEQFLEFKRKEALGEMPEMPLVPMTFGSEYYVERWYGILVLDFAPEAVLLDRWAAGAPYCMNHDLGDQRGIILNGRLENKILRGETKFSRNEDAVELLNDVMDQIRPFTSMGFEILSMDEIAPEDMPDELKNKCLSLQCPAYKVSSWRPYEGSSVPLGANPTVGVQYAEYLENYSPAEIVQLAEEFGLESLPKPFVEAHAMESFMEKFTNRPAEPKPSIKINHNNNQPKEDVMSKTKEQLEAEKRENKALLVQFGSTYKDRIAGGQQAIESLAEDVVALHEGEDADSLTRKFRGQLFLMVQDKKMRETPAALLGMDEKSQERYSVTKVLRYITGTPNPDTGKAEELGIEKEMHQEILNRGGKQTQSDKSILLPMDIMSRQITFDAHLKALLAENGIRTEKFDQTVGSTSGGGYLVGTQHRPQDMVDIFLNELIQGVTYMPGLRDNVDIPKVTGGPTVDVATAEAAGFSETSLTFGQILLSPKEIGAYIDVTRRLMVQSSPAIDALVSMLLFSQLALRINVLAIYGSGASGQPTGVVSTSGIGTFDGTSLGRGGVLNAEADVRGANVRNTLQWLLSSSTQEILKGRDQTAGFGNYLMKDDGTIIGYRSQVTEQMTANTLLLADPSEIVVAGFGNPELLVDRSTAITNGGARIALFDMFDIGIKHPGAFSYASSVS